MMKFMEIISETAAHDRAILSLSVEIGNYLYKKYGESTGRPPTIVGRISKLFDTPLTGVSNVRLILNNTKDIEQTYKNHHPNPDDIEEDGGIYYGLWIPTIHTVVLNSDYIGTNKFRTTVTHELRHALDDYISGGRSSRSRRYDTPKSPQHRKTDPYYPETPYLAKPVEINARYLEALHRLNIKIHRAVKRRDPELFNNVIKDFKEGLEAERIAELFPKGVNDPSYRRLFLRGIDYIRNEIVYANKKYFGDSYQESYSAGIDNV